MTAQTESPFDTDQASVAGLLEGEELNEPGEVIARLRRDLEAGLPWLAALLAAVRCWRLPAEETAGRHYQYLVGGEAFDWLLLAERLLESVADLVPAEEHEALLFGGAAAGLDDEALKAALGPVKYRAHLNFLYGVTVEEALQLSVEEDVHKEIRCRAWGFDQRTDETVFQRIYLKPQDALLSAFRTERRLPHGGEIGFEEWREFTYWLFKYRLRQCDPAKVASDTRRGLAQLLRLNAIRRARARAGAGESAAERDISAPPAGEIIDIYIP